MISLAETSETSINAEIVIRYGKGRPKRVLCVLQGLNEDSTRDEILEVAELEGHITDHDLNFEVSASILNDEEFEDAQNN